MVVWFCFFLCFHFLLVNAFPSPHARFPNFACSPRQTGMLILFTISLVVPEGADDLPGQTPACSPEKDLLPVKTPGS